MTEMTSHDYATIWRALRKARVKGASYSIFLTDDGTLGGSCGIQPIYNSGDTWSKNFGKVRTETAQAVQELSNALWDLHFRNACGWRTASPTRNGSLLVMTGSPASKSATSIMTATSPTAVARSCSIRTAIRWPGRSEHTMDSKLIRGLRGEGYLVRLTGSTHLKITHLEMHGPVFASSTPSDWRSRANMRARLRRKRQRPT
jgi:hypothetical protein